MTLSPAFRALRADIRARDHRSVVREPWERNVVRPA